MSKPDYSRVSQHIFVAMTGYTEQQIALNIKRGLWFEGQVLHRNAVGDLTFDIGAFEEWVLSGPSPAVAPAVAPAAEPAVAAPAKPASPVRTALYRHFDAAGVLLYVGISLSHMARLNQHSQRSKWFDEIASVKVEWFASRPEARSAEIKAIRQEHPLHNIAGAAK